MITMKKIRSYFILFLMPFISACALLKPGQKSGESNHLKLLSEYIIPFNYQFENTTVGGLSGIDFNPEKNEYYFISDDRSDKNPSRFYTTQIVIKNDKIDTVVFLKKTFLKDRFGNTYPNSEQDPFHTPDPEAMRYDKANNTFIWSSEGEKIVTPQKTILENPAVTIINPEGNLLDTFILPSQLIMSANDYGPRQNSVFEGLTFLDNYKSLLVSVEEPLMQDGPSAGTGDSSAVTRMIKFDIATKKPVAQYAYKIDPVAHPPFPLGAFKVNGISDILSFGKNKLLVIERSYSTGHLSCTIKIYLADLAGAKDIQNIDALKGKVGIKTIGKKLLLNTDDLGIFIDNVEGVTFGPTLSDGKKSLLFIVDNNFNPLEKSQVFLFEIE
jgi:hypothetical protein